MPHVLPKPSNPAHFYLIRGLYPDDEDAEYRYYLGNKYVLGELLDPMRLNEPRWLYGCVTDLAFRYDNDLFRSPNLQTLQERLLEQRTSLLQDRPDGRYEVCTAYALPDKQMYHIDKVGVASTLATILHELSVHPEILDLERRDMPRNILRTYPTVKTAKELLLDAIAVANDVCEDVAIELQDYWPRVSHGGAYLLQIVFPNHYLYLGEEGQLTSAPWSARKFETKQALLQAYFDNKQQVGTISQYCFLKDREVRVTAYDAITRKVAPGRAMDYHKVIAFDVAISAETNCHKLLQYTRSILRDNTIAGAKLDCVDLLETTNFLQAVLHRPAIQHGNGYVLQFRFYDSKDIWTWCRANKFSVMDVHSLAREKKCRVFPALGTEPLLSIVQSKSLIDGLYSTVCPETHIRCNVINDTKIINMGIWARLTHAGYDRLKQLSLVHRSSIQRHNRLETLRHVLRINDVATYS